jgi:hypothetical protein
MRKSGALVGLCGAMLILFAGSRLATAGTPITVEPFCSKDDKVLAFQALFPTEQLVVQLGCSLATRDCAGAQLSLKRIGAGQPLRFGDLGTIVNATLTHLSDHETQISWGVNHFTVDFEKGVVVYNTALGTCRAAAPAKR